MFQARHQVSDVVYNPAEQAFEARVTFHMSDGRAVYGARFQAGLDTDFAEVTRGILEDARKQARNKSALRAYFKPLVHARPTPRVVVETLCQDLPRAA